MSTKYVEVGTVVAALIIFWLLLVFVGNPIALITNSLIAIVIMFLLNALFGLGIPINIITILIVAVGGLVGLLLVIILRLMKVAFI
jgi:hypothetical protein